MTDSFFRMTMKDTDCLYDIVDRKEFPYGIPILIRQIRNPGTYVFATDSRDAVVVYEPAYGSVPWITTHSYSLPSARGIKLRDFYLDTGLWIIENTPYCTITCVVPDDFLHHGLFLAHIGATRQFHSSGVTMYTFEEHQLREFKERIKRNKEKSKCLKD